MSKRIIAIVATLSLAGCAGNDILDGPEDALYDTLADATSEYCTDRGQKIDRTRVEFIREIRQRGEHGPDGPLSGVLGLDDKTANGPGPVVTIWCEGDIVPAQIWEGLIRDWRD